MLDEEHEELRTTDPNHYILGRIGHHNIVIAGLNEGHHGIPRATRVLTDLRSSFPSVTRCLLVGIGGGFPKLPYQDIRLGDVIVGQQIKCYDDGKALQGGQFQRTGGSMRPSDEMATALLRLRARHEQAATATNIVSLVQTKLSGSPGYQYPETDDHLFLHDYGHIYSSASCEDCNKEHTISRPGRPRQAPQIHYGAIASGSVVIKDGILRERIYEELDVMCAETEAAGLMNIVPTLVIRGVSDYCDSHKNDIFQKHASANAAAFALEYLECLKPVQTHQSTEAEPDMSGRVEKSG
jgi:nucleoside phosphorylase